MALGGGRASGHGVTGVGSEPVLHLRRGTSTRPVDRGHYALHRRPGRPPLVVLRLGYACGVFRRMGSSGRVRFPLPRGARPHAGRLGAGRPQQPRWTATAQGVDESAKARPRSGPDTSRHCCHVSPKTPNQPLQQTAGAGRLFKEKCCSRPAADQNPAAGHFTHSLSRPPPRVHAVRPPAPEAGDHCRRRSSGPAATGLTSSPAAGSIAGRQTDRGPAGRRGAGATRLA